MAKRNFEDRTDRIFLRGIRGEYSLKEELRRLRSLPRVRRAEEIPFIDGPQAFSRHYLHPEDGLGQTLHFHIEEYAPGGKSQMHFHVNEAIFYILDGKGFELHDGTRYEWEAGDVAIVPNHTVHQHNNGDPQRPGRVLVMKAKPMFIFMNMLFQKTLIPRPKEPTPTGEGFVPREDE